ncbi:immunoglobulin gamma-1 heavy chain-like isoform X4 [Pygocentrus nattereri]|uniref:immunoglobulin gamma-1 heavy chain-like isoform X4 n=1 Tax=Pygocentrus nattereri TaxID=42514 RepID=UPI001890C999|nr:immunoglobulin gamma-1 heavy chain-like isoform X4 [Pygocentrus nattereri]
MFSTSLLLLLAAASCVHCEELTQPGSMVVRPGQSLTIDCKVSYSVTSYRTDWIRHPAGKALEWIGYITSSGSTAYSDKLKSKFSFSRDTGTNTITLRGQNLETEDTAVYYCARYTGTYFDYWGKGTSVTVSSAPQLAPSVPFVVSQCSSSPDGFVTLGCVTSGFFPESLKFSWTDDSGKTVSDAFQYPAVKAQGADKYTAVSHMRVKPENGKTTTLTCGVEHLAGKQSQSITVQGPTKPIIRLGQLDQSIMCVIEDFHPKDLNVKWKKGDSEVTGRDWITSGNYMGLNKVVSVFDINGTSPNENTVYTCEVTHGGTTHTEKLSPRDHFSLKINPPQAKDLFIKGKAVIECILTGDSRKEVEVVTMSWKVGSQSPATRDVHVGGVTQAGSVFTKTSTLTLEESTWFSGAEVICSTSRTSEKISVKRGGQRPSIIIYKPDMSISDSDTGSLVCVVSSSDLGNVYVMWKVNEDPYTEGNGMTSIVKKDNKSVVLSYLTVNGQQYNSAKITCAVKDANIQNDVQPRTNSTSTKELPVTYPGSYLQCHKEIPEEDEFSSLWSTASSFIFLFLFSLIYSTVLSLSKIK